MEKLLQFIHIVSLLMIGNCRAQQMSNAGSNSGVTESSYFFYQRPEYPRDCQEVFQHCSNSQTESDVYLIKPDGYPEAFEVFCNNSVDSGDWTVVQRRIDGSLDFKRDWNEYKKGFGFLSSEFWIGNEKLSFMLNQNKYKLRIDIITTDGSSCYSIYDDFRIKDEWGDYALVSVGEYSGNTGVEIVQVNLESPDLVITERNSVYSLHVNISVESDVNGVGISGTSLWNLAAFIDTQQNCRSNSFPGTRTENMQTWDMPLVAGETLSLTNILFSNMNLSYPVCPDGPLYLCVEFDKHPNASPPFTLKFVPDYNTKYASVKVTCRGVEILQVNLESLTPVISERSPLYSPTVNVSVESDASGASISGTSLWKLVTYFDTDQDCMGYSYPETRTENLQTWDTSLVAGETLSLKYIHFPNMNILDLVCPDGPLFLCVEFDKHPNATPPFTLKFSQDKNTKFASVEATCQGVEIVQVNLERPDLEITERDSPFSFHVNVSVEPDVNGAGISGTSLWNLVAFLDDQQDCRGNSFPGTHTQNLQTWDMPLVAGETLSLTSIFFSNMNLLNLVCPDGPLYLCVEFDKHSNANPPFSLKFLPDENTKYASVEATCRGVEIVQVNLDSLGPEMIARNPSYCLSVNVSVESDASGASITGTYLWNLVAFFDTQQDCTNNSFPGTRTENLQTWDMSLAAGETLSLTNILFSDMNLLDVVCSDRPLYLCVEFDKHPNANPPFTLDFSPNENTKYASVEAICQGDEAQKCSDSDEKIDCYCELCDYSYVSVSDDRLKRCYCKTPSGMKCSWLPQDCHELYKGGIHRSAVYTIYTTGPSQLSFNVYCNMTVDGGGWTVFQRHLDSSVNFRRSWPEYQDGFGDLMQNFWLGNGKLCNLTQQQKYKLYIIYWTTNNQHHAVSYDNFTITCANKNYTLASVGLFSGETQFAVDGLTGYVGMNFNTYDRRDGCEYGWWCCPECNMATNLNEYYGQRKWGTYPIKYSEMKLKPFID